MNRLGDSGVNTLGDTSAFVNPTVQLLLTQQGKIRMDGVGIVFEFYSTSLSGVGSGNLPSHVTCALPYRDIPCTNRSCH